MRFPHDVPTLSDGVVTLRAHRPQDAVGSLEQSLDPLSRKWTTIPLEYTRTDADRFVRDIMPGGWLTDQEWGFAVEAPDSDGVRRYAGTVSLRNEGEGRAELAYGSHPFVRGSGVMERALRLLLAWGFEERGLKTVIWWANQGNWASRKLAWRLGFNCEGAPRQWLPQRGSLKDAWVATLLRDDPQQPATPWYTVPRITGRSVVLRRLVPADADRVVEGCSDPETARWLGNLPSPYRREDADWFIGSREDRHAAGIGLAWAVADPTTNELIGVVELFDIQTGRQAEIGYWVHPSARGRGVATEVCRLVLRHAFVPTEDGGLGLVRVKGTVAEGNLASRRVLSASGMTTQGRERRALRVGGGELVTSVVFDILAEELRVED